MRHSMFRSVALSACAALGLAAFSASVASAQPGRGAGAPAGGAGELSAMSAATTPGAAARPVLLLNGDLAVPAAAPAAPGACVISFDFVVTPGLAGQVQTLLVGGKHYVVPVAAAPYLGRGLDPSLFDVGALARQETQGRLPVQVAYVGGLPRLPGVTITGRGAGTASGYLTAAGARAFGQALLRQFLADRAGGRYGQDGLFANGVSLRLAGAPGQAPRPARGYRLHTLTVTGANLTGKPDTGDLVWLFNADNASRFDDIFSALPGFFYHGTMKFSVPAGHYWAIGDFINVLRKQHTFDERLAVLRQFSVGARTTVSVAERSATSRVQMITPRPTTVADTSINLIRFGASGPPIGLGWFSFGAPHVPAPGLYVTPVSTAPTVGTLDTIATGRLDSPPGAPGVPYQYDLAFQRHGAIGAQRYVVRPASLATESARFYSAVPSKGYQGRAGVFPIQGRVCGYGEVEVAMKLPARQTAYLSAAPSLAWFENYAQSVRGFGAGGQYGTAHVFLPGQRVTEDFGAYPLHPAPIVQLPGTAGFGPAFPSAARSGNKLALIWNSFSDNVPGDAGGGVYPPFTATASYQIDQNGKKIAGRTLSHFFGGLFATAKLAPTRSTVRFVLSDKGSAKLFPLSGASRTVWTWRSAPSAGKPPPGWVCLFRSSSCTIQPLLTLRYAVTGLRLTGSAPPGVQVLRISVGHLQAATAAPVTKAGVTVSFNGGKTWHPARVIGRGGSYAAVFTAPAGAKVTLRTSAADAAGGAINETIPNAYQVAQ